MHDPLDTRLAFLRAEMREIEARLGTVAEHPDDLENALRLGHEAGNMLQLQRLRAEMCREIVDAPA